MREQHDNQTLKGGEDVVNANKVKGRLVELGMTQQEAATALGMTQPTLSQKINNLRAMDLEDVERLGNLLGITVSEYGDYFFYHPSCET